MTSCTSILLNGGVALGAVPGVSRDPVGSLGVVRALLLPLGQHLAVDRFVPLVRACEAELKSKEDKLDI